MNNFELDVNPVSQRIKSLFVEEEEEGLVDWKSTQMLLSLIRGSYITMKVMIDIDRMEKESHISSDGKQQLRSFINLDKESATFDESY